MYILKWKNTKDYTAKVGEYLANTQTDSSPNKNSRSVVVFFTKKDITDNEGNIFDSLNLNRYSRKPSWKQRFDIIKIKV